MGALNRCPRIWTVEVQDHLREAVGRWWRTERRLRGGPLVEPLAADPWDLLRSRGGALAPLLRELSPGSLLLVVEGLARPKTVAPTRASSSSCPFSGGSSPPGAQMSRFMQWSGTLGRCTSATGTPPCAALVSTAGWTMCPLSTPGAGPGSTTAGPLSRLYLRPRGLTPLGSPGEVTRGTRGGMRSRRSCRPSCG